MELPDGTFLPGVQSLDLLRHRLATYPIANDLAGKRVLDIGAWDGWFSFELEKRGAKVTSVDAVEIDNFLDNKELLGSQADYRILDVMELSPPTVGTFDVVLFLGVLYHLKHPLLALERVCALTTDLAIVESHVVTDAPASPAGVPILEFYETDELGRQIDNWFGPTVEALLALCRTAGFARVELLEVAGDRAAVACYRRWPEVTEMNEKAPVIRGVQHHWNAGINFRSDRDEYITAVFESAATGLSRESVFPEIAGYGTIPVFVAGAASVWTCNFPLPKGLVPGWHEVRLRTQKSVWSNTVRIAVDLPADSTEIRIHGLSDGTTWEAGVLRGEFLTLWISGLGDTVDRNTLSIRIGGRRHPIVFIGDADGKGLRQVNVKLRRRLAAGNHKVQACFGSVISDFRDLEVIQD